MLQYTSTVSSLYSSDKGTVFNHPRFTFPAKNCIYITSLLFPQKCLYIFQNTFTSIILFDEISHHILMGSLVKIC